MNKQGKRNGGVIILLILAGLGFYFFIYDGGIHNPLTNSGNGTITGQCPDGTIKCLDKTCKSNCDLNGGSNSTCVENQDCWNTYKSCYYICNTNQCNPINTFVPVTYPNCNFNEINNSQEICPAMCYPMYSIINGQCKYNLCGSGCGPDNLHSFSSLSKCKAQLIINS